MLSNEEIERFAQHYHRHGDQVTAAQYARPDISEREAYDMAARILQSEYGQRMLIKMKKQTESLSSLEEYVAKLEEIRDKALEANKFGPALQSHVVLGKLAGFFDRPEADQGAVGDATQLSNEELLRRIEKLTGNPPKLIELRPERMADADNRDE